MLIKLIVLVTVLLCCLPTWRDSVAEISEEAAVQAAHKAIATYGVGPPAWVSRSIRIYRGGTISVLGGRRLQQRTNNSVETIHILGHGKPTEPVASKGATPACSLSSRLTCDVFQVTSKTTIVPGEFGQLLINLPNGITPLAMSHALVRWVSGQECGLEFIRMDLDDKGRLNRLTGQLGGGNPFS